jgi:hypothetical protein
MQMTLQAHEPTASCLRSCQEIAISNAGHSLRDYRLVCSLFKGGWSGLDTPELIIIMDANGGVLCSSMKRYATALRNRS